MKLLLPAVFVLFFLDSQAQLKTSTQSPCATINVDILDGKVNGLSPRYTPAQIKKVLPCFSREEKEDTSSRCGGGVFYKAQDISFYTGRDYIEIGEKFKGSLSVPLMGAPRNSLFKWLGNPVLKDTNWDAYTTSYGVLVVYYNKASKVNKLQFSTESTSTLKLCD